MLFKNILLLSLLLLLVEIISADDQDQAFIDGLEDAFSLDENANDHLIWLYKRSYCWVKLDPHLRTFDGRRIEVRGVCTYRMAASTQRDLNVTMETYQRNIIDHRRGVSFVKQLIVDHKGKEYRMTKKEVFVDKVAITPPYEDDFVTIWLRNGKFFLLGKVRPFMVVCDRKFSFYLVVRRYYGNKLCGLCGNCNGDPLDDLRTSSGTMETDDGAGIQRFVASWATTDTCLKVPAPEPEQVQNTR